MEAILGRLRASRTYASDVDAVPAAEQAPRPQTMAAFLDQLDSRYGGVLGWLAERDFGSSDVRALRAKLVA